MLNSFQQSLSPSCLSLDLQDRLVCVKGWCGHGLPCRACCGRSASSMVTVCLLLHHVRSPRVAVNVSKYISVNNIARTKNKIATANVIKTLVVWNEPAFLPVFNSNLYVVAVSIYEWGEFIRGVCKVIVFYWHQRVGSRTGNLISKLYSYKKSKAQNAFFLIFFLILSFVCSYFLYFPLLWWYLLYF